MVAGLPDRWMFARPCARLGQSLPAPLWAHCDVDVRSFKLRSRRAGTLGEPQIMMQMNAMVAITCTQAAAPVTKSRHAGFAARGG